MPPELLLSLLPLLPDVLGPSLLASRCCLLSGCLSSPPAALTATAAQQAHCTSGMASGVGLMVWGDSATQLDFVKGGQS
jgi:hypothetical protein